jgi:hypothetical protein
MDMTRLRQGERIAALSAIALILIMFLFDWYGPTGATSIAGTNAWESYSFIDIILFITALSALGLAYLSGTRQQLNLPVAASAIVTGLGVLSLILIIVRILATPDYDFLGRSIPSDTKAGVWLGLIATAALTYGAYRAMQEEGTTYGGQAARPRRPRDRGPRREPPSGSGGEPPPPSTPGP